MVGSSKYNMPEDLEGWVVVASPAIIGFSASKIALAASSTDTPGSAVIP